MISEVSKARNESGGQVFARASCSKIKHPVSNPRLGFTTICCWYPWMCVNTCSVHNQTLGESPDPNPLFEDTSLLARLPKRWRCQALSSVGYPAKKQNSFVSSAILLRGSKAWDWFFAGQRLLLWTIWFACGCWLSCARVYCSLLWGVWSCLNKYLDLHIFSK